MIFDLDRDLNRFNVLIDRSSLFEEFKIKTPLTNELYLHIFRIEYWYNEIKIRQTCAVCKIMTMKYRSNVNWQ